MNYSNWYKKSQIQTEQGKYLLDTDEENYWAENDIKELEEEQAYLKWEEERAYLKDKETTLKPKQRMPSFRPFKNIPPSKSPNIEDARQQLIKEFKNDLEMAEIFKNDPEMIKTLTSVPIKKANYYSEDYKNHLEEIKKDYNLLLKRKPRSDKEAQNKQIKKQQYENKMNNVKNKIKYYDFVIAYFINLGKLK